MSVPDLKHFYPGFYTKPKPQQYHRHQSNVIISSLYAYLLYMSSNKRTSPFYPFLYSLPPTTFFSIEYFFDNISTTLPFSQSFCGFRFYICPHIPSFFPLLVVAPRSRAILHSENGIDTLRHTSNKQSVTKFSLSFYFSVYLSIR